VFTSFSNNTIASLFSFGNEATLSTSFFFGRSGFIQGGLQFVAYLISFGIGSAGG